MMNKTKKNVVQLFSKNKKKEVIPIFTGLTLYRTAQSKYYFETRLQHPYIMHMFAFLHLYKLTFKNILGVFSLCGGR